MSKDLKPRKIHAQKKVDRSVSEEAYAAPQNYGNRTVKEKE